MNEEDKNLINELKTNIESCTPYSLKSITILHEQNNTIAYTLYHRDYKDDSEFSFSKDQLTDLTFGNLVSPFYMCFENFETEFRKLNGLDI